MDICPPDNESPQPGRCLYSPVNWRSRENLLRLTLFLAAIGVIVAAFLLHSRFTTFHIVHLGYLGVGLSALLASGSLIVPVPALAAVCVASLFLFPLLVGVIAVLVGVIAGIAETIGGLTG
jgi:hypothetical protein